MQRFPYMRDIKKQVGERIRFLRGGTGLSVNKLALLADMDPSQLSKVERGLVGISIESLDRIAQTLEMTVSELTHIPSIAANEASPKAKQVSAKLLKASSDGELLDEGLSAIEAVLKAVSPNARKANE